MQQSLINIDFVMMNSLKINLAVNALLWKEYLLMVIECYLYEQAVEQSMSINPPQRAKLLVTHNKLQQGLPTGHYSGLGLCFSPPPRQRQLNYWLKVNDIITASKQGKQ